MSNRLRATSNEGITRARESCVWGVWTYGLSADARTSAARLKAARQRHIKRRNEREALEISEALRRLRANFHASVEAASRKASAPPKRSRQRALLPFWFGCLIAGVAGYIFGRVLILAGVVG